MAPKNNSTCEQGWYDVRLNKGFRMDEKRSIWDRIYLFFGGDVRRKQWVKVWSIPAKRTIYLESGPCDGEKGVIVLFRNGLGDERAEIIFSNETEDVNVEWAKGEMRKSHNVTRYIQEQ